ncbi:hypothetical protein ACFW1A_28195 [Kitasatospora sp. NPDC058965]|uniref:hypothetical protein n=1 Tax=Kitasatospora sp. NPDC058965 TaxID=3346682 RepID=UPI0036CE4EBB
MTESLESAWTAIVDVAKHLDDQTRRPYEVGLTALVHLARPGWFGQYYPFTAMGNLCFSDGPQWWMGTGTVLSILLVVRDEGGYDVWPYNPYPSIPANAEPQLCTDSAAAALVEAQRILQKPDPQREHDPRWPQRPLAR